MTDSPFVLCIPYTGRILPVRFFQSGSFGLFLPMRFFQSGSFGLFLPMRFFSSILSACSFQCASFCSVLSAGSFQPGSTAPLLLSLFFCRRKRGSFCSQVPGPKFGFTFPSCPSPYTCRSAQSHPSAPGPCPVLSGSASHSSA